MMYHIYTKEDPRYDKDAKLVAILAFDGEGNAIWISKFGSSHIESLNSGNCAQAEDLIQQYCELHNHLVIAEPNEDLTSINFGTVFDGSKYAAVFSSVSRSYGQVVSDGVQL